MSACGAAWNRLHQLPDCPEDSELAETQSGTGIGCYRDGKPNGPFSFFYPNGALEARAMFRDGVLDGTFVAYHPNGRMKFQTAVKQGLFEGPLVVWREDGSIAKIATHKHDRLDGPYEERRPDGSVTMQGQFENGVQHGKWTYLPREGKKPIIVDYEHGRVVIPLLELRRLPDDADAGAADAASVDDSEAR